MAGKFTGDTRWGITVSGEVVNGTDVIQTTTGNKVSGWGIGTSHDPGRPKWNGMNFVAGICIPDNQLAILRRGNEVSSVSSPVHRVDLSQMAFEGLFRLQHLIPAEGVLETLSDVSDCMFVVRNELHMYEKDAGKSQRRPKDLRFVSASSSFLRFILSLSVSASRRAA